MAKKKAWGGRFDGGTDRFVEEFTASIPYDVLLYRHDIAGSVAHARMLGKQGILPKAEAERIVKALSEIRGEIESGKASFELSDEDIHMAIESRLIRKIGPLGGKLHTGRSRNDQVATDLRLYLRDEIDEVLRLLEVVEETLVSRAEELFGVVLPGYTHLQPAQPILFSHYLLAYREMFSRDADRFRLLLERKAGQLFVALRGGEAVAYAAVRGTAVVEYAGALEDVAALMRAVFEQLDDPHTPTSQRPPGQRATVEMRVLTPDMRDGLPGSLMQKGIPHAFGYLGMVRMLDPIGLFGALGLDEIGTEAQGQGWRLSHRGKTRTFGERELARLIFGPERPAEFAADILPVPFYQWPADRV